MVTISIEDDCINGHILLEPNISLSWKANTRIFLGLCIVTGIIATYFYSLGGWLVIPFSIMEMVVVSVSVYMFFIRNNHCEVITFTDDKIIIEQGKDAPEKTWEYCRHWSKIYVQEHGLYDIPEVRIKSHGKSLEIGSFLGQDEKLLLIDTLEEMMRKYRSYDREYDDRIAVNS